MVSQPTNSKVNDLALEDRAFHDWYRFVLSYPAHLVREYLEKFGANSHTVVLDPFCGTGTTLVECKKLGISSIGIDANPVAFFASQTKTDWQIDPTVLIQAADEIAQQTREALLRIGIDDDCPIPESAIDRMVAAGQLERLPAKTVKILIANSISPLPLHKALLLLDKLNERRGERFYNHARLALVSAAVQSFSNLHFGPEVGVGTVKTDAPVIAPWLANIRAMARDLEGYPNLRYVPTTVHHADARMLSQVLEPASVDCVITSPPYPNEKDYTRITRLETVLLGFADDRSSLQALKRMLLRSNTRNVYKGDSDDYWIQSQRRIHEIAAIIEQRRIELGKTSGFERLYSKVTKLYFGGIAKHLAQLRPILRPGAQLAYVVGDQASYLRVMIRTGQLTAEIAESLGYEVTGIDLFRTRLATATRDQLREEVVLLKWNGGH